MLNSVFRSRSPWYVECCATAKQIARAADQKCSSIRPILYFFFLPPHPIKKRRRKRFFPCAMYYPSSPGYPSTPHSKVDILYLLSSGGWIDIDLWAASAPVMDSKDPSAGTLLPSPGCRPSFSALRLARVPFPAASPPSALHSHALELRCRWHGWGGLAPLP